MRLLLLPEAHCPPTHLPSELSQIVYARSRRTGERRRTSTRPPAGHLEAANHQRLLDQLRAKNILAEHDPADYVGASPTWLSVLSTRAVARWACNVASDVVLAVLDSIPESDCKHREEFFYRENFRRVGDVRSAAVDRT